MIEGILSFLKALPRILALMEKIGRAFQTEEVLAWLSSVEKSIDDLEKAVNKDEKIKAAQRIASDIRSL